MQFTSNGDLCLYRWWCMPSNWAHTLSSRNQVLSCYAWTFTVVAIIIRFTDKHFSHHWKDGGKRALEYWTSCAHVWTQITWTTEFGSRHMPLYNHKLIASRHCQWMGASLLSKNISTVLSLACNFLVNIWSSSCFCFELAWSLIIW